jgi:AcrR family transcriptional regulator
MAATGRKGRKRTGRTPGSSGNREGILKAAQESFMEKGYDGTTIRGIAAAAGVDPALVHHFFGSKDELLLKAHDPPAGTVIGDGLKRILSGGRKKLGENFVREALSIYDTAYPWGWGAMVGLIRSASSRPEASRLLRETFGRGGISQLVATLGLSQPELRTALIASEFCGLAVTRFVVKLEPLASADVETVVALYGPVIQRYLSEPLT